jgi:translation elongation factor EF-4
MLCLRCCCCLCRCCCCCCCRYASFDYEEGPQRPADLSLLELLVNGKSVDALARLVPAGGDRQCLLQLQL